VGAGTLIGGMMTAFNLRRRSTMMQPHEIG